MGKKGRKTSVTQLWDPQSTPCAQFKREKTKTQRKNRVGQVLSTRPDAAMAEHYADEQRGGLGSRIRLENQLKP